MNVKRRDATTLQTVSRALAFLDFVARSEHPPAVKEISAALDINITTTYHLYNTLFQSGYIERNPDATLRIGFASARLYDAYTRGNSEVEKMDEIVDRLAATTQETTWISRYVDDAVVLTAYHDGFLPVRATGLYLGLSGNEHQRSSGRAVLAYLDDADRSRVLDRSLGGADPEERARIEADLEPVLAEVRSKGWALDDEGYREGIIGLAVPFFSSSKHVLGAVGVWAPAERGRSNLDRLVADTVRAAATASEVFGRATRGDEDAT